MVKFILKIKKFKYINLKPNINSNLTLHNSFIKLI